MSTKREATAPERPSRDRARRGSPNGSWPRALGAVAVRPWLWPAALGALGRLAPPRWWRHRPFLPVPDRAYLAFRLETQYGTDGAPAGGDLVSYLEWCRSQQALVRRARARG